MVQGELAAIVMSVDVNADEQPCCFSMQDVTAQSAAFEFEKYVGVVVVDALLQS